MKYCGSEVKEGDYVEEGQVIGYSGNTGFSTMPHLHFHVAVIDDRFEEGFRTLFPCFKQNLHVENSPEELNDNQKEFLEKLSKQSNSK